MRMTLAVATLLAVAAGLLTAQASDTGYTIVRGTVVRQVHTCEIDGPCSVVVQTDSGEKNIVWNQGDAMPPPACRDMPNTAAPTAAEALQPGDRVEIHLPEDTGGVLCGPNASVARLQ